MPAIANIVTTMTAQTAITKLSDLSTSTRHPVILFCDPLVQSLALESLPSLKGCYQAMCRVHFLRAAISTDRIRTVSVTAGVF